MSLPEDGAAVIRFGGQTFSGRVTSLDMEWQTMPGQGLAQWMDVGQSLAVRMTFTPPVSMSSEVTPSPQAHEEAHVPEYSPGDGTRWEEL